MAKLKGVEVVEIKKLLYKGEEYSHVDDMPEVGDIIRVDGSWISLDEGDMFICKELDSDGDAVSSLGHCNYRKHYDVFRKVSTPSIGGIKTEKRRANIGEEILITDATATLRYYKNGDILTVKEVSEFFGGVDVEEFDDIYIGHDEYEVIVNEQTEETFKVGDKARVVSVDEYTMNGFNVGDTVIIEDVIEDFIRQYSINNDGLIGYANSENLEKIEPISVGDYAKVVGEIYWNDLKPGEYVKVIGERDSDGDFTIERLDGSDFDYAQESSLERVELSDNDIALLKLGRKIGEYRVGDIVRVSDLEDSNHGYEYGELTEIREIVDYGPNRIKGGGASRPFLYEREIELVTPVEARVDKDASQ